MSECLAGEKRKKFLKAKLRSLLLTVRTAFSSKGQTLRRRAILMKKGGFDESNPLQEKNPYIGKIKTVQFIYIFKKVGLINQAPT
jgi:hypothetical protein